MNEQLNSVDIPRGGHGKSVGTRRTQIENRVFRRDSLIQAAIWAIAHHDISGATIERICTRAGASRGLIAHYFDSKDELLVAALNALFDESLDIKQQIADDESMDVYSRIKSIAHSNFMSPSYSWEKAAALQAFTNASRYNTVYKQPIHNASKRFREIMIPLFTIAAIEQELILTPVRSATGLYALTDGLWNSLATDKDNLELKDARKQCDVFIRGCFH